MIFISQPQHPFDISIYGDYIFSTNWVSQDELMFRAGATRCRDRILLPTLPPPCEAARWPLTGKQPPTITTEFYHIFSKLIS
uniref:Uncharacterized protein n=1 Tax=Strigamia maritima TaxID=126957 RepID=T1J3L8_STRMM